jgi:hypothetical protein
MSEPAARRAGRRVEWTRSQRIRTATQRPFAVAIRETALPPVYQQIAAKAADLTRLGLSLAAIAQALSVSDKTVAKSIGWFSTISPKVAQE